MLYYTIQHPVVYEKALSTGFLKPPERSLWMFENSYDWMILQAKKRLPHFNDDAIIWLWTEKPDMRKNGFYAPKEKCVRLTIELEPTEVLLSDFYDWHIVLNNMFNAYNEQEWENYWKKLDVSEEKEKSWERIFDLERKNYSEEWSGKNKNRELQAVTGKISIANIVDVSYHIAK